jgi:hypothetical protein
MPLVIWTPDRIVLLHFSLFIQPMIWTPDRILQPHCLQSDLAPDSHATCTAPAPPPIRSAPSPSGTFVSFLIRFLAQQRISNLFVRFQFVDQKAEAHWFVPIWSICEVSVCRSESSSPLILPIRGFTFLLYTVSHLSFFFNERWFICSMFPCFKW